MLTCNPIKRLIDWFEPDVHLINKLSGGVHEGKRFCRLNIFTALIASVIVFLMFVIRFNIEGLMSVTLYSLLVVSILIAFLPFVIKYTARYQLASSVIVAIALVVIPVRVIDTGGLGSAVLSWYMGTALIAFVIGSIRLGMIFFIISLVEIFVIYQASVRSWVSVKFSPSDDIQFWVFSLAFTLSVSIIFWYESQRLRNIRKLERRNETISSDNELLAQQKRDLEKANLDKSTLLNVLCHDVANPLQVIKSFAEILDEEIDRPEVKNIIKATSVIDHIIEHLRLLQVANGRAGKVELGAVRLADCLEQTDFVFRNKLQEKSLSLNINDAQLEDITVLAEPVSLSNFVINNIISNAIKFSEYGQSIDISLYHEDDEIHLVICDHGIGMPEEIVNNLFAISRRVSRKGTQGETGTGLGMKVMAAYVESYGGRIKIESTEKSASPDNHGTTFHLWLKSGK